MTSVQPLDALSKDPIENDFLQALKRLQDGAPKNKKLKEQKAKGTLKINASSLALEAGRSRTLIGLTDSKYAKVRALLLMSKNGGNVEPQTHGQLIKRLREEKADLIAQIKTFKDLSVSHLIARVKAEKDLEREKDKNSRLVKELASKDKIRLAK